MIVTSVNEQPAKADAPILSVFFEIVTLASAEHPLNALSPMLITDLGRARSVMPVQPAKALSGIDSIPDRISSVLMPVQPENALSIIVRIVPGSLMSVIAVQSAKALSPMTSRSLGHFASAIAAQPLNASFSTLLRMTEALSSPSSHNC